MKIVVDKKIKKEYNITLNYDELNSIYHAIGNYVELLDSLIGQQMGLFLTTGESALHDNCRTISEKLRSIEPELFYDLSFETNAPEEHSFNIPFGDKE